MFNSRRSNIINKSSLVDDICEYLRNDIFNLKIKPGTQINELELIKKLGVSRSPIREAIRIMEGEGLLERVSRKGVFIKKITLKETEEIFSIRGVLESLAAKQAIGSLDEKKISILRNLFEKMDLAQKENSVNSYVKLNFDFHRTFIKLANNNNLERLLANLGRQSMWFLLANISIKTAFESSQKEHLEILKAFEKRDEEFVARAVERHIANGKNRVVDALRLKSRNESMSLGDDSTDVEEHAL